MRVLALLRAADPRDAGVRPAPNLLAELRRFNEDLVNAGVTLAGEAVEPGAAGVRVTVSNGKLAVVDRPAEPAEVLTGLWLWQVRSIDEAIEWARRCPNPTDGEAELELRSVVELGDWARPVERQYG